MSYKIKDDISRDEIAALVDALNPFYAFGSVLQTANQERGTATVTLYAGKPPEEKVSRNGCKHTTIPQPEDYENEIDLDELDPESCILGAVGTIQKLPASFMAPVLQARHFSKAFSAFLACIEDAQEAKSPTASPTEVALPKDILGEEAFNALAAAGYAVVPFNPTERMMQAGLYQSSHDADYADVYSSYQDMVNAYVREES